MAVDQEVGDVACVPAESQNRLDVGPLWQYDARSWLDRVVKPESGSKVRIEGEERLRVRPLGVENRQDMGDAPGGVVVEFVEAADGERGEGERFHARCPSMSCGSEATRQPIRGLLRRDGLCAR